MPWKLPSYVFVYQAETDGGIAMERLTREQILERISRLRLTEDDFVIAEGTVLSLEQLKDVKDQT